MEYDHIVIGGGLFGCYRAPSSSRSRPVEGLTRRARGRPAPTGVVQQPGAVPQRLPLPAERADRPAVEDQLPSLCRGILRVCGRRFR